MEELLKELISSVNNLNKFSIGDIINIMALVGSWITILFLLLERYEKNRPYLQITFELVRSSLACVVLRNTGNVPLTVKNLHFDDDFVKQLPEHEQKRLLKNKDNITIFPNKQWVICLGVIIPDILNKYEKKDLKISYSYSKLNKKREYDEYIDIDFEQYSGFLVYVSEIDELQQVNKKIQQNSEKLNKEIKKIHTEIVQYHNTEEAFLKTIIEGDKKN